MHSTRWVCDLLLEIVHAWGLVSSQCQGLLHVYNFKAKDNFGVLDVLTLERTVASSLQIFSRMH